MTELPQHIQRIGSLLSAPFMLLVVVEATKLRIPDLLAEGPRTAEELAKATGTLAGPLGRMMRALASTGIVVEREDSSFEGTDSSEVLRDGPAGTMRNLVLMFGGPQVQGWLALGHTLRTGELAFEHVFGKRIFEYFAEHPDDAEVFNNAMSENTRLIAGLAGNVYDFGRFTKLMDVGGGHGELMISILNRFPTLQGALLDLPNVVDGAHRRLEEAGLAGRCEIVAGSFFETIPPGADAIIMKAIIHDWEDAKAAIILGKCREALPADGKLLLVDRIMPQRITPSPENVQATFMDMNMMVNAGGLERTEAELDRLLGDAGFKLAGTTHLFRGVYIAEAVPA